MVFSGPSKYVALRMATRSQFQRWGDRTMRLFGAMILAAMFIGQAAQALQFPPGT
jgi:hypothetical protein